MLILLFEINIFILHLDVFIKIYPSTRFVLSIYLLSVKRENGSNFSSNRKKSIFVSLNGHFGENDVKSSKRKLAREMSEKCDDDDAMGKKSVNEKEIERARRSGGEILYQMESPPGDAFDAFDAFSYSRARRDGATAAAAAAE